MKFAGAEFKSEFETFCRSAFSGEGSKDYVRFMHPHKQARMK